MAAYQRLLDNRLRSRNPTENTLRDVQTLFNLLPQGGASWSLSGFTTVPPEQSIDGVKDVSAIRKIVLRNCYLKKFKGFSAYEPKTEAIKKFKSYEDHCALSNQKIRSLRAGGNPWLQAVLLTAQHKISKVLGDFDVEELIDLSRWGPGVTSSCKGSDVSSAAKFSSRPDVTREFLARARILMPLFPSWSALLSDTDFGTLVGPMLKIIQGNKISFVPKTAKIHRAIAVEPHVNVFFQNGLGRMIRRRLKKFSVDLDDQTLNQRLARLGSVSNDLATIDLEGASDTICVELVRDLLPEDWFTWLNAARSQYGELEGNVFRYQKFSSMGNGATFDLESLIFWAVVSAVVQNEGYNPFWVNVFGDDIVCPSGCYDKVVEALTSIGFIVNKDKSFHDGPFRESCGKDYLLGEDIRPVYLKDIPSTAVHWIRITNQLRLLAHKWGGGVSCDSSLRPAWLFALSRVPKELQYRTPAFQKESPLCDAGIFSNFDEATPDVSRCREWGWEGFHVRGIVPKAITRTSTKRSLVTAGVFQPSQQGNEIALRDQVSYREKSLFISGNWYDLGPWVSFS